jgi:DNA (cytosine-5)-methyltransferase 1
VKGAYYNEFDPFAAAWLRELMNEDRIAPGEIDTRSIEDVSPDDLRDFTQCHFFAGIGVWSLALRNAGWPDNRPIWTGSCPCQPFSAAGKGGGFDDERHLWPAFLHLIHVRRPPVVAGEQVASKDGLGWLDLVQADLEGEGYAFGAVDTCAAGFGAPHIRQRLYWVADANDPQRRADAPGRNVGNGADTRRSQGTSDVEGRGGPGRMADTYGRGASAERQQRGGEQRQQQENGGGVGGMADTQDGDRRRGERGAQEGIGPHGIGRRGPASGGADSHPGPTNGLWRDVDWLGCRDGKWRPVEPATSPLADAGTFRNRVAELRGAGNAINLAQAQGFIEAIIGD